LLAIAEAPYTWAVLARNRRYDSGAKSIHRVNVPVISVGNLTLGGTGKTPMVEWIIRQLLERQKKVGIVSRGYGAHGGMNDEAMELAWKLPGVPHVQNPDRVAAARRAIDEFGCDALVLDDAFQHRRIARDLDIVLLDALEPLGYERVFPRGTLREPIEGLARANAIVLSRADLMPPDERAALRERVANFAPAAAWAEVVHAPLELVSPEDHCPLESLRGRRVMAFCGLGNPAGFRHTLAVCGYDVAELREFPDHHRYNETDLIAVRSAAERLNAEAVVCTQKDLVKINLAQLGTLPLWAVRVGIDFLLGQDEFLHQLDRITQLQSEA
jgi:tetraacyldisaccharide 4'-kinase